MKNVLMLCFVALVAPFLFADAGVLIPRDKQQPNPAILSLEEMEITVRIDNGDARVFVRQVFVNHTSAIEEGNYIFALPSHATISDFATWDGPVRLPAVILERKRAEELYNQLKQQAIDPGLLQQGERGPEEAKRSSVFSAKIVPIAPFGTKRLEIEYHESIPVENLKSYFAIPLRPDAYAAQAAGRFRINFEFHSAHAIRNFEVPAKTFPLQLDQNTPHLVQGHFEGENVNLGEDFVATWDLDPAGADSLQLLTYRNPDSGQPSPNEMSPVRSTNEPGFFEADALLGFGSAGAPAQNGTGAPSKTVIVLFDTSLSMQWEKLERSYQALETLLHSLRPTDHFALILFNTETQIVPLSSAEQGNVQRAIDSVRASRLRGGTDLQLALRTGLAQATAPGASNTYLVILSDGGATRGPIQNRKLGAWYASEWNQIPETQRPRTYILAVGDDANLPLFRMLAQQDGVLEQVLSTEPIEFKLNSFLSKIGRSPIGQMDLTVTPANAVDTVYPLQDSTFSGSMASWVGRYQKPQDDVGFTVHGVRDGTAVALTGKTNFPQQSFDHPQLPRSWARARVDALLAKIERDGEDQATIDEIIQLARKYKFVTPYTSFLAVPRALLRPRVIRPGDPILRVKTDESIVSVVALFPFGLVQPLRHLSAEDIWQTRFLAPTEMQDGTYTVRLILRDQVGHTYRESKTFVIASKPPVVSVKLERTRFQRGQNINLRVSASESTRSLVAQMDGANPVALRWDPSAAANTGTLTIPEQEIPGTYNLTVTAEDIAHNIGTQEVQIEVLP
ncbi:MAG TPA: VIT and VWA domain-containing protein [Candidatus Acidoferrales bacterium]|nr:VIT and VWA domain-containing protein [Candidatus Acidoferrales bacterium]